MSVAIAPNAEYYLKFCHTVRDCILGIESYNPVNQQIDNAILSSSIDVLLVPQGAEYAAVCRGLQRCSGLLPQVQALPVGPTAVSRYLQNWVPIAAEHGIPRGVLLMGLCGSLNGNLSVGQRALYRSCSLNGVTDAQMFDVELTTALSCTLAPQIQWVNGLTSDRIICSAQEKQHLAQATGADVVDMEGYAVLQALIPAGIAVAMLRVVSDDCHHDLPDLNHAIDAMGALQPLPLVLGMLRQPIAAIRLIRGSLQGLQQLEKLVYQLFQS
jgi:hypothetical protein